MTKKRKPKVSIVVPCYNCIDIVENAIDSILKTKYRDFELIISDDKSTDGTYELINKKYSKSRKVKIIQNVVNSGPSITRNNGIKATNGKYVSFLETDMEVAPGWLKPLVDKLESNNRLAGVQSKVCDLNKKKVIQACGLKYDPNTFWVIGLGAGEDISSISEPEEVSVGAVGSMVKKSVLNKVGGFDEMIIHNIDDIDLGWRIWISGGKIVSVPESVVYHWTAKPLNLREKVTPSVNSEFYFHKTPRIFIKNYEWENVIKYMPMLYIAFIARSISNILRGNFNPFKGMVRATIWNIMNLSDTLSERKRINSFRKFDDDKLLDTIFIRGNLFHNYYSIISPLLDRTLNNLK